MVRLWEPPSRRAFAIVKQIPRRQQNLSTTHHHHRHQTPPTKMTIYNINITSDIVCPWCYIGHARLSKAIANHQATYPSDKFNLTYQPYYLNPAAQVTQPGAAPFPIPSQPKADFYAAKFGAARAQQIFATLGQVAKGEGLTFKFGGRTGSSRNGHRLVHYAQSHGGEKAQNEVMLGLWRRYFEQEIDITQLDVLTEVGVEAGLGSADSIREFLVSGRDAEVVDQSAGEARQDGISGVPFYVVQEKWAVEGAQEPSAFEALFKKWKDLEVQGRVESASASNAAASKGDSC